MDNFFGKIKRSGLFETVLISVSIIWIKLFSLVKVLILNARGYKIEFPVEINSGVVFAQSKKLSIEIGKGTKIGSGARIKSGMRGGIIIGKNVIIDDYVYISSQGKIEIGNDTMIAANVYIVDFNHVIPLFKSKRNLLSPKGYISESIKIGKYVWIGANAVILPGVVIGDNAVVGAGSIVTKNIPARAVAVGNPAKVIKKIK